MTDKTCFNCIHTKTCVEQCGTDLPNWRYKMDDNWRDRFIAQFPMAKNCEIGLLNFDSVEQLDIFISAEIAVAVAKERERVVYMISHIRSRNHVCPDCSELCHCYTVCDKMNIEYALKNYEGTQND